MKINSVVNYITELNSRMFREVSRHRHAKRGFSRKNWPPNSRRSGREKQKNKARKKRLPCENIALARTRYFLEICGGREFERKRKREQERERGRRYYVVYP